MAFGAGDEKPHTNASMLHKFALPGQSVWTEYYVTQNDDSGQKKKGELPPTMCPRTGARKCQRKAYIFSRELSTCLLKPGSSWCVQLFQNQVPLFGEALSHLSTLEQQRNAFLHNRKYRLSSKTQVKPYLFGSVQSLWCLMFKHFKAF